jgi:pyridoxine kinase
MNVLSIQSWVAYGHVGNAAAIPSLNALGHTVWAVPTVIYSNHPGHGGFTGRVLPAEEVSDLLAGIAARGVLGGCAAVLSGYLGALETGPAVLEAVERTKTANPRALYLCDPVIGEAGRVFVRQGLAEFFRDRALGRADILTPNAFELAFLSGVLPGSLTEAAAAASDLRAKLRPGGPRMVLVSGLELASMPQQLATLLVHEKGAAAVATPRIAAMPPGSGDALAALFLGALLSGAPPEEAASRAASSVHALAEQAAAEGLADLPLVSARQALAQPPMLWPAEAVA